MKWTGDAWNKVFSFELWRALVRPPLANTREQFWICFLSQKQLDCATPKTSFPRQDMHWVLAACIGTWARWAPASTWPRACQYSSRLRRTPARRSCKSGPSTHSTWSPTRAAPCSGTISSPVSSSLFNRCWAFPTPAGMSLLAWVRWFWSISMPLFGLQIVWVPRILFILELNS